MIIRVWKNNYDLVDETLLKAGQYTKVAPGEYHQFEAITDCIAFEFTSYALCATISFTISSITWTFEDSIKP
jgi:hypothetical protein